MSLGKPDVRVQHLVAALKACGHVRVALFAERLADRDTAKELEELAGSLPITGASVRRDAAALRARARKTR